MALHGAPKRFQSDQGTQLVAASKQLATWDWTAVHEQAERVGAEWHIVPTGGQHYNGQAERLIGLLKRCLESALNNRKFTLGELSTAVAEAAQVVNSRPIARNKGDPETGGPITPLHLQLGRATVEVPRMRFEEAPRLTQRLQFIEEAKRQFWKKWMQQVFSGRILNHKWTKKVRHCLPSRGRERRPHLQVGAGSGGLSGGGWMRAHRESAVHQSGEAWREAVSTQDHDSTHPQSGGGGTNRVCIRGRFVRQHSWLEMPERRPPFKREDGDSRGTGGGTYQGEGGGARERGSPARGPQEAGETQEGGQATGKRAGGCGGSSGGRSAPGGRESDPRDKERTTGKSGPQEPARQRTALLSRSPPIGGVYGLQQAFFYRKRPPQHTRRIERGSIGERDIVPSTQDLRPCLCSLRQVRVSRKAGRSDVIMAPPLF
jgi:hypothetical protein